MPGREAPADHPPDRDTTRPDGPQQTRYGVQPGATALSGEPAMRTLLVPAAVAALLATSALFFAAVQHATGTVKAFDSKAMTLTLAGGDTYQLRKTLKNPGLKAGEKVSINWEMNGTKKMADTVTIIK
jgi:Cu/Ag efflux protein CusF